MKEGLFILALLIVSSYAIDVRHPGQPAAHKDEKHLKPASAPVAKASPAAHPAAAFRAKKLQARAATHAKATVHAAAAHHAGGQQGALEHEQVQQLDSSSSSTGPAPHVKKTPGAPCHVYETCVECTDDTSKPFYCMWSAARNVCQIDTDMDKIKRATPEDLWTKQCAPKDPEPITNCNGCPILAIDKKPERDIVDSKIKGSNGDEVSATEGSLKLLGTNPDDPVTGPITHPNGTFGPIYLLPSIRDEDGNIKDPVQDKEKLTYSPCVGDGTCGASARFVSAARKGKFHPDLLTDDSSANVNADSSDDEPRMQSRHVPHVDKVDMQDAQLEDENKDSDDLRVTSDAESSELEVSSRVVKDEAATPAPGGGFTPAFSDDDTSSKDDTTTTTPAAASSSDDTPRFKQTKNSEFKGMSAEKKGTQSKESTMEVTEFDDNVVGGKRINEDDDSKPTKEEADDKQ